jgi:hypothetical protein
MSTEDSGNSNGSQSLDDLLHEMDLTKLTPEDIQKIGSVQIKNMLTKIFGDAAGGINKTLHQNYGAHANFGAHANHHNTA